MESVLLLLLVLLENTTLVITFAIPVLLIAQLVILGLATATLAKILSLTPRPLILVLVNQTNT